MRACAIAAVLTAGLAAGCEDPYEDVLGPFTGRVQRYRLDSIDLPGVGTGPGALGIDLNGDNYPDNQLGQAIAMLAAQGDVTKFAHDMIAAGTIASRLEVIADDPENDPTVGVRYLGQDDAPHIVLGGTLEDGWFRSNPMTLTHVPGEAMLVLPVFAEADPSVLYATGMEMNFSPDGAGGVVATIHCLIPHDDALWNSVATGFAQMLASDPGDHRGVSWLLDHSPKDGAISVGEVANNGLLVPLLYPDATTLDGRAALSFGFAAHFLPCTGALCSIEETFDHCWDRIFDGDETDLDCGGSCQRCEGGAQCLDAGDCETPSCDQGHCAAASCTDGVRDGSESDVDCGGDCRGCATGQRCYVDSDCGSNECGKPCVNTEDNPFGCLGDTGYGEDVCYARP